DPQRRSPAPPDLVRPASGEATVRRRRRCARTVTGRHGSRAGPPARYRRRGQQAGRDARVDEQHEVADRGDGAEARDLRRGQVYLAVTDEAEREGEGAQQFGPRGQPLGGRPGARGGEEREGGG